MGVVNEENEIKPPSFRAQLNYVPNMVAEQATVRECDYTLGDVMREMLAIKDIVTGSNSRSACVWWSSAESRALMTQAERGKSLIKEKEEETEDVNRIDVEHVEMNISRWLPDRGFGFARVKATGQ